MAYFLSRSRIKRRSFSRRRWRAACRSPRRASSVSSLSLSFSSAAFRSANDRVTSGSAGPPRGLPNLRRALVRGALYGRFVERRERTLATSSVFSSPGSREPVRSMNDEAAPRPSSSRSFRSRPARYSQNVMLDFRAVTRGFPLACKCLALLPASSIERAFSSAFEARDCVTLDFPRSRSLDPSASV